MNYYNNINIYNNIYNNINNNIMNDFQCMINKMSVNELEHTKKIIEKQIGIVDFLEYDNTLCIKNILKEITKQDMWDMWDIEDLQNINHVIEIISTKIVPVNFYKNEDEWTCYEEGFCNVMEFKIDRCEELIKTKFVNHSSKHSYTSKLNINFQQSELSYEVGDRKHCCIHANKFDYKTILHTIELDCNEINKMSLLLYLIKSYFGEYFGEDIEQYIELYIECCK